mmetsp:Transcript_20224/g.34781  ORF Transcript_20224/g.34781 Transcript_20224/m.34781 type:complete len:213 (+) Transcript_20224:1-639(+)
MQTSDSEEEGADYGTQGIMDVVRARTKWLALFCAGLVVTAGVIEHFEATIASHVELSFFVPLIMGHGGNTGSQTVSNLIRALALRQVRWSRVVPVVLTEAAAGGLMGGLIGIGILGIARVTGGVSPEISLVVAISLPCVSLWSNGLAAFVTLASSKLKLDPTMTAGPLSTTLIDTTGLVLYFCIAQLVLDATSSHASPLGGMLSSMLHIAVE